MHYSAKHGIVIACRPSVCNGGSGPHRLEILISRTISQTPSLFVAQSPSTY